MLSSLRTSFLRTNNKMMMMTLTRQPLSLLGAAQFSTTSFRTQESSGNSGLSAQEKIAQQKQQENIKLFSEFSKTDSSSSSSSKSSIIDMTSILGKAGSGSNSSGNRDKPRRLVYDINYGPASPSGTSSRNNIGGSSSNNIFGSGGLGEGKYTNENSFINRNSLTYEGLRPEQIPRTGTKAGRTVAVTPMVDLHRALRMLHNINSTNNVKYTAMSQTKYEKPGKRRQRIKMERNKRKFKNQIKQMFELVAEARRKGY